ncbi:MAG TPA: hypothetical protein VIO58_09690 [Candidatus Methanoperedens sp.]
MTTDVTEDIGKTMGWCPQKDNNIFQAQIEDFARSVDLNPRKSSGFIEKMDVPLYMLEWRMIGILLILISSFFILSLADHLNRTPVSYLGAMLIMAALMLFVFLLNRYRISINSENLLIRTPVLLSIKIPKNRIKNIKSIDNIIYKQKHGWGNTVLIISIIFFSLVQFLLLYQQIVRSIALEDAIMSTARTIFLVSLFIIMYYRHSRYSHYPKAIQIDAGNNITLCPRNEFEFNILKEELET